MWYYIKDQFINMIDYADEAWYSSNININFNLKTVKENEIREISVSRIV